MLCGLDEDVEVEDEEEGEGGDGEEWSLGEDAVVVEDCVGLRVARCWDGGEKGSTCGGEGW